MRCNVWGDKMRRFATAFAAIVLTVGASPAADMPDMGPLNCAWDKLEASEQTRLKDEFRVDLNEGGFIIHFADANATTAAAAATVCTLNLTAPQTEQLALALSRRAGVEKAKKGIADKGEDPKAIASALEKMHEGKREVIGDKLSCPGPHSSVGEWDESVRGAVRRANLRFKDGRAYAWVSLGIYASVAQEGALRRMAGKAEPC